MAGRFENRHVKLLGCSSSAVDSQGPRGKSSVSISYTQSDGESLNSI